MNVLKAAIAAIWFAAGCTQVFADDPVFQSYEFAGRPYLASFPDGDPRGLVWMFHGRGGNEAFAARAGNTAIVAALVEANYAIVSPQSTQRNEGRGNDRAGWLHDYPESGETNPDLERLFALYRSLIDDGRITARTPVFTHGMSNGGGMAVFFGIASAANGHPVAAIADYMGPLPAASVHYVNAGAPVPPIFLVIAGNDALVDGDNQRMAARWLQERGGHLEVHEIPERPLSVEALVAQGISNAEAERLIAAFGEHGFIDSAGRRLIAAGRPVGRREDSRIRHVLDEAGLDRDVLLAVRRVWAVHQMRDDMAAEQLAFFGAARSGAFARRGTEPEDSRN